MSQAAIVRGGEDMTCGVCRALYAVLLSPEVPRTNKAPMFLALLFKVSAASMPLSHIPLPLHAPNLFRDSPTNDLRCSLHCARLHTQDQRSYWSIDETNIPLRLQHCSAPAVATEYTELGTEIWTHSPLHHGLLLLPRALPVLMTIDFSTERHVGHRRCVLT